MRKIPTMFVRDWAGDRSRVTREVAPGCEWVVDGYGVATVKLDGTCCLVRNGKLYKRRELRADDPRPPDFDEAGRDDETGKTVGWMPVGDGPDDKYHREAWGNFGGCPDGTYELIGPKVQGNPEREIIHKLVTHGSRRFDTDPPRDFDGLAVFLADWDIEGIVFHHPDGRMAKIKKRDFGLRREIKE